MLNYLLPKLEQTIWAPSSEFVSSSIPSWQISTAHAQPFRGARDLVFCLKVPLDSLLLWASSEGSGETARMRRLAWTFAARIGDKYQIRLTRSICPNKKSGTLYWSKPLARIIGTLAVSLISRPIVSMTLFIPFAFSQNSVLYTNVRLILFLSWAGLF